MALDVAQEILRQMGGIGRLTAMIGARQFVGDKSAIQFKWAAKSSDGSNAIRIELTPADTYTVTFYRIRGASTKATKQYEDVYAEDLVRIFEDQTGLYLRF